MTNARARVLVFATVAIVAAAGATAALALGNTRGLLRRNKAAARADALALLRGVGLPSTATRSVTEPSGDHGFLRYQQAMIAVPARRMARAWWILSESPSAVLSYVKAHPPKGTRLDMSGTAGDRAGDTAYSYGFDAPPVPGKLGAREVVVTATALTDGQTGVLVEAQSDYIIPRPSGEKVPAGAHSLDVTVTRATTKRRLREYTFTGAHRIHRAIRLIDSLPILQPGVYFCPAMMVNPRLRRATVNLRATSGTKPLATVTFDLQKGSGSDCDAIAFAVRGHSKHMLVGLSFRHRLARILGIRL